MANKLVTTERLSRFLYQIRQLFLTSVLYDSTNKKLVYSINGSNTDIVTVSTLKSDMELESGESNQNAFSNVLVDDTTISADTTTDTLTLVAGDNITLTPDATDDEIIIAATDTTYSSKTAVSGGTDVSLVTTGEKYTWNNMLSSSDKGVSNGVCPLNSDALIDSTYLPSYVDDVIEAYPVSDATELASGWLSLTSGGSAFTPETGKIYILMADSTNYSTNGQFRWSGSTYVEIIGGGYTLATDTDVDALFA